MKIKITSVTSRGIEFIIKYNTESKHCIRNMQKKEGVVILKPSSALRCKSIIDLYRLAEMTETNQDISKYRIY